MTDEHYRRAIIQGIMDLILSISLLVAYFIVYAGVDPSANECGGVPYAFANFARWAYLGYGITELVLFPLHLRVGKKKDMDQVSQAYCLFVILTIIEELFLLGVWIYACIAISHQGECQSNNLITLLWVTVIGPVAYHAVNMCCSCYNYIWFAKAMAEYNGQNNRANRR